jgi:hypothetical protein
MMFQPSKTTFPIAPLPRPYEPGTRCSECKTGPEWNWFDRMDSMAASNVPAGAYIIDNNQVKQVCGTCRKYIPVDRWTSPLFLQGWLPDKTKEEWKTYHDYLFTTVPKHIATFLYHDARTRCYQQRIEFNWEQQFSSREVEWLNQQFHELTKDLDCVDNLRAARRDKKRQVRRYWKIAENGCCGSKNVELFCAWNSQTYLLGCNYGH